MFIKIRDTQSLIFPISQRFFSLHKWAVPQMHESPNGSFQPVGIATGEERLAFSQRVEPQ